MYNYLFYCAYKFIEPTKKYQYSEIVFCVGIIGLCISFNLATLAFLLSGLGVPIVKDYFSQYGIYIICGVFAVIYIYYSTNDRERKVLLYFEQPWGATGLARINKKVYFWGFIWGSAGLMGLAAAFMHRDWIFSGIPVF